MPLPEKLVSVPPETVTSELANVVEASLSVKVMTPDCPAIRLLRSLLMAIVGNTVSTVRVTLLLLSAPSALELPAASVKVPEATEITPLAVLLAVGVNVAV